MAGQDETDDKPLDPEAERVRRKIMRFFAISVGITLIAVMAVLGAVVYKLNAPRKSPAEAARSDIPGETVAPGEATIPLEAGTRILSESLSGNRILLDTERADGSRQIVIYDMAEGRIIKRLNVGKGE